MVSKSSHIPHKFSLSAQQHHKLMKGDTVQLKPSQLEKGSHEIYLTPQQARRVKTALKHGRGLRLQFDSTQRSIHTEGGSLLKHVRRIGRKIHHHLKPHIRSGLHHLVDNYAPEEYKHLGHVGVDFIGDETGGYGYKKTARRGGALNLKKVGRQITRGLKTVYKETKPYLREGLHAGVDTVAMMTGNEALAPAGHLAVNVIGDKTGAYGIRTRKRRTGGALYPA